MSFPILYQDGGNPVANLFSIAVYIDSFAKSLGLASLSIDSGRLTSVAAALCRPDFPHSDGLEKASPFKKAANFFVWFVSERPIIEEFPEALIGPQLRSIQNHQNVIVAYHMAVDCLHKAKLFKKAENGDVAEVSLDEKVRVSDHFFDDFVDAYSAVSPQNHFKSVSLLFEQMVYKANPGVSYDEVI